MASSFSVITFSILVALLQSHFLIVSPCMSCISPWTSFGNHCYLLVTDEKTFDEAEQNCQSLSRLGRPSHLASIMSQEDSDFLLLLIKSVYGESGMATWFGFRKDTSSGSPTWRFIDDSSSQGYTNWHTGQPSGDGPCAEIHGSGGTILWNDLPCNSLRRSVCKITARF
ncbi:alpha-N-acetylgalactosamine-specific lectin-like [Asterias rubens]|uniref:alpha-N-acetylgalactosamine-specific lectin-like n=1 Tax=Asterias rubens TaxID=7604 RepID=UPI0014556E3C|nr:alpha-N-acetylgalactosamine-specific lectin-like [Asterias rubens]